MEDARTWQQAGYRSAAEQSAAVSGSSVSAARNLLETSKQLESLPATANVLRARKLSPAKAAAIASAATVAPEAEAVLLSAADAPLAAVRDKCLQAHRTGWTNTHRTRLDDLDRLCEHGHDLKTYYGWALITGTGRRPMVPPDDPRHPRNKPPPEP